MAGEARDREVARCNGGVESQSRPDAPSPDLAGRLRDALAAMPEVELAYLFGSQAQGRARPASDIDVAVLVSEAAAADARAELARLFDRVGAAVGSHRLDLVLLNGAPSLLRHRVVSRGRLLLARDACQRVRFIARAIQDVRRGRFYRRRVERIRTGTGDDRSGDLLAQARRVARLLGEAARVP